MCYCYYYYYYYYYYYVYAVNYYRVRHYRLLILFTIYVNVTLMSVDFSLIGLTLYGRLFCTTMLRIKTHTSF